MSGPLLFALLTAASARAAPSAPGHAARATGFPGSYAATVALSLRGDPLYASRLLDALALHLKSLGGMRDLRAVSDYLALSAAGTLEASGGAGRRLRESLGREAMPAPRAAAILLAHALHRPEQFPELLDAVERERSGLGRHAARLLREAGGPGEPRLLAALRAAGARGAPVTGGLYGRGCEWAPLFDGAAHGEEGGGSGASADAARGYDFRGRPRPGLRPAPRAELLVP